MMDWRSEYLSQIEMAGVLAGRLEESARKYKEYLKTINSLPTLKESNDCKLRDAYEDIIYFESTMYDAITKADLIAGLAKDDFTSQEAI